MIKLSQKQYKIWGEIFLLIPEAVLIVLGIGEISGGIISGLQHFVQLLPLLALAIYAWYRPKTGGYILLGIAFLFFILYIFFFQFPLIARIINSMLLFGLPVIGGIFFIKANDEEKRKS